MSKHHVGSVAAVPYDTPAAWREHCSGYRVRHLVGPEISSACVLTGAAMAELDGGGHCGPMFHAFEKSFYILEGELIFAAKGMAHRLGPGHYGLIAKAETYSLYNPSAKKAVWFEVSAPQPKPVGHDFVDTYFPGGDLLTAPCGPGLGDPRVNSIGAFDHTSMGAGSQGISAAGARSSAISGITLKELVDGMFGAQHLALFLVQFQAGGGGSCHDHPHEEVYVVLSGSARARLDGHDYVISAGEYAWTGVGCFHEFYCIGDKPVRWIETQAPLPARYEAFQFRRDWDPMAKVSPH